MSAKDTIWLSETSGFYFNTFFYFSDTVKTGNVFFIVCQCVKFCFMYFYTK